MLLLSLLASALALASPAVPVHSFKHYGHEQGLTSLSVETITQDREGFLWVGTQDGLFRYDGERFRRFGREAGLPSTFVFRAVEVGGTLWVGTRGGLARREGDRFVPVPLPGTEADPQVDVVEAGCSGSLLVGWAEGGFLLNEEGQVERLLPPGESPLITALRPDCAAGRLWIGAGRELLRWDGHELSKLGAAEGLDRLGRIGSIVVAPEGTVYVRTADRLFRRGASETRFRSDDRGLPPAREAVSMLLGRDGQLWATSDLGLARRTSSGFEVLGRRHGLASDAVKAVFEDREGNLWVGNDAAGLDRWLGRGVFSAYTAAERGLSHDVVWAIERDRRGELWVGTQHGLNRLSPDADEWRPPPSTAKLAGAYVLALEASPQGLWVGSYGDGLMRLESDGRAVRFGAEVGIQDVASLLLDKGGGLWVAASTGLFHGDAGSPAPRFARVVLPGERQGPQGKPLPEVFFGLLEDSRGRLWAAGRFGLALRSRGTWTRLTKADGLEDDFTSALAEDTDGTLWIAYRDRPGLSRLRFLSDKPRIERVPPEPGLSAETVTFLGRDRRGRLWVGSTTGVSILENGRFRHLDRADGLRSADSCQNAFFADASGLVWIGTPEGLVRADLGVARGRAEPLPVVVTSASLDGVGVDRLAEREPPDGRATFAASFAALAYAQEEAVRFRYRLEGYEDEDTETDQRQVRYPRLPPGDYAFSVRAFVPGREAGDAPAFVRFRVAPGFWDTPAARGLMGLGALGLLAGGERLRHRLLRRRNRELARLVAEKTRELAEASFNDPLTGLRNRRFFDQVIPADVQRALRRGHAGDAELLFCLIDLDHFKRVNDSHGHAAGDAVLVEAGKRLRAGLREADLLVRWGGEEFLVVFRDSDRRQGQLLADRLLEGLRAAPIYVPGEALKITASLGWVPFPFFREAPREYSLSDVLALADKALYMAKQEGRNRGVGLVPRVEVPQSARLSPEHDPAKAFVQAVWSVAGT